MIGSINPLDPRSAYDETAGAPAQPNTGVAGFMATTLGKSVVGGVALLTVAGAFAAILFLFVFSPATDEPEVRIIDSTSVQTTPAAGVASPQPRPAPRLSSTFTFRNIFKPSIRPSVPATETSPTADAATPEIPPDTLYLQEVSVVDGRETATLIWNGQTYLAGEGDELEGTPWKVVTIRGTAVTMLYGDSTVTLVVGQALGK